MPFNSLGFWAAFTLLLAVYAIVRKNILYRNLLLLLASYAFYVAWDGRFVTVLLLLTVFGYAMGLVMDRSSYKRPLLILSIAVHLIILTLFKHFGFFAQSFMAFASTVGWHLDWATTDILLPLGISFYVFQILGYHIDIYRGTQRPVESILNFALFVAFFPKIVAGPIERVSHLVPQFEQQQPLTAAMLQEALFLITWGLVLKFVIAENAAIVADDIFERADGFYHYILFGIIAFTLQIYADFGGYSSLARGIALLLGFELVWNFRQPYFARSPSDFWRRWHISLSEWFRDYVYIPLGGNRKGALRTAINLLLTMGLVGLWHGSRTPFIVWGLYHGALLALYRAGYGLTERFPRLMRTLTSAPIAMGSFFLLTLLGWAMFRSKTLYAFWLLLRSLPDTTFHLRTVIFLLSLWLPVLAMDIFHAHKGDQTAFARLPIPVLLSFSVLALYALLFLPPITASDFIYVQF